MARSDNRKKRLPAIPVQPFNQNWLGNSTPAYNHTFLHGYLSNSPVTYRFACGERFLYGKNDQSC